MRGNKCLAHLCLNIPGSDTYLDLSPPQNTLSRLVCLETYLRHNEIHQPRQMFFSTRSLSDQLQMRFFCLMQGLDETEETQLKLDSRRNKSARLSYHVLWL